MARISVERLQGSGVPIEYWRPETNASAGSLIHQKVMLVTVASFTFRFISKEQISDCLAYYERKVLPSSMQPIGSADHWEIQRWFERLPMYLLEEPKRAKVVKALKRALLTAEGGAFSMVQSPNTSRARPSS